MTINDKLYHTVSLSGGKDSTAMLLMMLKRGIHITVPRLPRGFEYS